MEVDLPDDFLTHMHFKDLDEKTQAALTEIREQFGAGDLTEAQAQTKVEALGLDFDAMLLSRGPHGDFQQKEAPVSDESQATTTTSEA